MLHDAISGILQSVGRSADQWPAVDPAEDIITVSGEDGTPLLSLVGERYQKVERQFRKSPPPIRLNNLTS
jgi:hypothetical protein